MSDEVEIHKKFNPESRRFEDSDGWISVKDKLPEEKDHGYYIVCLLPKYQSSRIKMALYDEDGFTLNHETINTIVTHYMSLPSPPKDK